MPCGTGRHVSAGGAREATRQDEQLPARVLRRCADASSARTLLGVGADGPPASRGYCSPLLPTVLPTGALEQKPAHLPHLCPGGHPCSAGPTAPGPGSPCGWADAGTGPCPHRQYYWYDERGKKVKCTAPQYVDFVMSSVQKLVTDEDVFPTKYGACLPAASSRWPQLRRGGQPRDPGCRARPMPSGRGPPGLGQDPPPALGPAGRCGQMSGPRGCAAAWTGLAGARVPVRLLCGRGHAAHPPASTRRREWPRATARFGQRVVGSQAPGHGWPACSASTHPPCPGDASRGFL